MEMEVTEDLGPEDAMEDHMTPTSIVMQAEQSAAPVSAGSGSALGSAELGRRLLLAARLGDTAQVLELMARGAPFTADWLGTSALHCAAGAGHADTCAVLLRAGVSRDCRTKVERTPLHLAAHAGHAAVAQLLLRHRAAPHCRDLLRMTPLHWAAARGHCAVARALLQHGADPRALCKFGKTPLSLARDKGHRDVLALLQEALEEREAARSVESLRVADGSESAEPMRPIDPLDGLQDAAGEAIDRSPQPAEPIEIDMERPSETPAEQAAAAMLRRHGIALLPRDEGSTVLSALQSGRSVVLSDAGKLMLKESSEIPHVVKSAPPPTASKGVVLTATPIKSPPKQGVKIFTLNNKLLAMPKETKAPVKKVINPHDSVQIQYIKLSSESKTTATKSIPMKAKNKLSPCPAPPASALPRPTVKLMMQKANLNKLLAPSENGSETVESKVRSDDRNVLFVPEEFLTNSSPKYLRTQLLTAHKTIASLNAELDKYKARLSKYENI